MLKGGGGVGTIFGVALIQAPEVLAMLRVGQKRFAPPKTGWGVQNVSDPQFSHFVSPPPHFPVINDRSLSFGYHMIR